MTALVMLTAVAPLSATTSTAMAGDALPPRWHVVIHRDSLSGALTQLARQTHVELARFSDLDFGLIVGPLSGDFSREEALKELLRDTGLTYRFINANTVAVLREPCEPGARPEVVAAPVSGLIGMKPTIAGSGGLWSWVVGFFTAQPIASKWAVQARLATMAALCGTVALAGNSRAQAAGAEADSSGLASLEEVIVTAQRREENAQKVPISIDIVGADDAELRGATTLQTLSATIPNLINTGGFYSHTYIRGVGAANNSPNNEPSAATYVDGVYMPSSFALSGSFNNIERVEVLKGPQGTLFGRNTTGGVVQIITADPEHEFRGKADIGYANYDMTTGNAYLTGGLSSSLAADLAVTYENQGTGWGHDLTTKGEIYKHRNVGLRSKWLYTPSDVTKLTVSLDYTTFFYSAGLEMMPGSINPADGVTTYAGRFNSYGDPTIDFAQQYGAAARLDHDFSSLHGTSITSYRHVEGYEFHDNDRVAARRSYVQAYNFADYVMQEFQLSNRNPGRVTWLTGLFVYGNLVDANDPRIESGTTVVPAQYREVYGRQKTRSYSAYGQATADLVADTKLTLGLRYTDEVLTEDGKYLNAAKQLINGSPFNSTISFRPWTWRVALDHQFSSDVLGYVSYNHGFKSGGYNLPTPERPPFLPETLNAYELGLKSELLDHRIRVNAAVFYYDYKNIQVIVVPGNSGQLFTNAGAARNYGLDAGLEFAATDHLTLSSGLGLLDAKYTDFPNAQGFTALGAAINLANAKGQSLPFSPPITGFVAANYRMPTSVGEFRSTVSVSYNDRFFITPTELPKMSAYTLVSASVEWRSQAAKPVGVRLWGRNLANEYYALSGTTSSGGWYASYAAPRTYGVSLLKDF